ncbi:Axonemal beta dynein heavy chain 5, partial [Intoshia linei]
KWRSIECRVTDGCNEAKDTVKFLYTLEKHCDSIYHSRPQIMMESLPGILNSIRMIYTISRYYNTPQKMTSLFVKITNQIITSCKSYLTDDDFETVWTQPPEEVITRINECIELNQKYQYLFKEMKNKINESINESINEKKFEISEMYIFGKFDNFITRLKNIVQLFEIIDMMSNVQYVKVEGLETICNKIQVICASIKKKPYDFLDQRRGEFTNDMREFNRQITDMQLQIEKFLDNKLEVVNSSRRAFNLIKNFEWLNLSMIDISCKYQKVLIHYSKELDSITKNYQRNKNEPPASHNMTPFASKISWARKLFENIYEPMKKFRENNYVLKLPEAKRIIKHYNRIAKIIIEYELLYYRAWKREILKSSNGLKASLLVKHPETQQIYVNFDPAINLLIAETYEMTSMDLEIPDVVKKLYEKRQHYEKIYDRLQIMIEKNNNVRNKTPEILKSLLNTHHMLLDQIMEPGFTHLNWHSLRIDAYIEKVNNHLENYDMLISKASDIIECRINNILLEMEKIELMRPATIETGTISIHEFIETTEMLCKSGSTYLHRRNLSIEKAVQELVVLLCCNIDIDELVEHYQISSRKKSCYSVLSGIEEDDNKSERNRLNSTTVNGNSANIVPWPKRKKRELFHSQMDAANELLNVFSNRITDTLLKLTRQTLENFRRRISKSSFVHFMQDTSLNKSQENFKPFFSTEAVLTIPNISMTPTIEEVQQSINQCAQLILRTSNYVTMWNNNRFKPSAKGKRFSFAEMYDISKSESNLSSKNGALVKTIVVDPPEVFEHSLESAGFKVHMGKKQTYFSAVSEHKEVNKLISLLSTSVTSTKKEIMQVLETFNKYNCIWLDDKKPIMDEFMASNPSLYEYECNIKQYESIDENVKQEPEYFNIGALQINTDKLKNGIMEESKLWRIGYANLCNIQFSGEMQKTFDFIDDMNNRLPRPIKDLDDIRLVMSALDELRANEISIDMNLTPIEESYSMLGKHDLPVPKEETERVDSMRYSWEKLRSCALQVQSNLLEYQPKFYNELVSDVKTFNTDCTEFYDSYKTKGPMVEGLDPRDASDRLIIFQNHFDTLYRKYETYSGGEVLFGLPVTCHPNLLKIRKELNLLQKLYNLYNSVIDTVHGYYDILWSDVDIEKINLELQDFQLKCRKLPKGLKEWPAYNKLRKTIDDFNEIVPLLELMAKKAMQGRHWKRIEDCTKHSFDFDNDQFALKNILEAPLLKYKDEIEDICISAGKEREIEAKLKQVIAEWDNKEFVFASFKNRGEILLRGDTTSEIISIMEDSLMVLSSLLSNRYNTPFKKKIQHWSNNLSNSSEIIDQWINVQNLWVYLEAVFVGGDIAKQLPQEAKRFSNIDKAWIKLMTRAIETPNAIQCCVGDDTLGQLLPHLLEQLELCQKSLTGYLEKKRALFPRFYFVSDPALLEILGQASDPHTIQAHLLSIFDNIKTVKFHEKNYDTMLSVISSEGEVIELQKSVRAEGNIEIWLMNLLVESQKSLHFVIRTATMTIQDSSFNLTEFLSMFIAQVGLLGLQLIWTRDATIALKNARYDKKQMGITNKYFISMLNDLIKQTTFNLSPLDRTKYETLITIHVHQRDIFEEICNLHVRSPLDFEWQKQTRFYFMEDIDKCIVSITDIDFEYQNEFLGCTERLVITPLTDRCYITLAQAQGMAMGGAPAGPAGTGKTETVKDMGRCLGKYVVVFNCSDQMDFRGLGRIYKGLAQSGTWGCFDEFNRIDLPVLSVAAQQIAILLSAKKERKREFIFTDGDLVSMNPEFGIFLTMNPGYAGRQELPENLKINFRTVAMMVPDRQIIIRVKLASIGFIENIILSRKFFTLYKLCEEQLTKQVHYDFGLRNMLSVLRTLGNAKRNNPDDSEQTTVMKVLRNMNLSKLVDQDESLFLSLIDDLFPGIILDKAGYPELEVEIDNVVRESKLVNHDSWNLKLIQLYETQRVRHGMMALGPSGSGKTKCIQTLMKAMSNVGSPHKEMRMNPKAITSSQMFGTLDVATNDWTDGIFSTLWRRTLKVKKGDHIWIVLDGPVDAIWIENLNSVLDDNKTLTLANGDRIPMSPTCKIIFEPHNIDNASPATVSRNGMVFMSSSALGWRPILQAWLFTRNSTESAIILALFDESYDHICIFSTESLRFKMEMLEAFFIRQACDLMEGLLMNKDEREQLNANVFAKIYVFTIMWSIGALLDLDDRIKLQEFMTDNENFKLELPECVEPDSIIFDYVVGPSGHWVYWGSRVEEYIYPKTKTPEYASILVPNIDNIRIEYLIEKIAKQDKAILLIGESGTAKTVMINAYLKKFNAERHISKCLNFSSATTPLLFQRTIESYVDKRMGTTYGPPSGKMMTVFIDDINMPTINEWSDQVANEIVRQLMEMKGFYSLEKPGDFIHIVDVNFMAAMITPGGGRNDIPQRLKRQFNIFNCTMPSNQSIDKIFSVIACGHFVAERNFTQNVIDMVKILVPVTRRLWQLTKIKMLPTPAKFHYIFNLRDLSRIWQGMLNSSPEVVTNDKVIIGLWKHEFSRVISDRFTEEKDCLWMQKTFIRVINEIDENYAQYVEKDEYFVDFLRDAPEATGEEGDDDDFDMPKIYEPIEGDDQLKQRLNSFMLQYNESIRGSGLDLVFFRDAMYHIIKISRIIRTPRGNALLVGVGGSGKQSLTRLASYIADYKIFQITLTRAYNVSNLLEDLKGLYRLAGQQGIGVTFLFTDQEIKDESFLEYLNNILSSGVVSNLFARDEMDEILQELIPIMKQEYPKRPPTNENLYDYFLSRSRANLHVVLCFSPVGEKFQMRALKFPGLISGCTIDWFQRWPLDALVEVAEYYISNLEMDESAKQNRDRLVQMMGRLHDDVAISCVKYFECYRRTAHVTPKSYLSFLTGYRRIYEHKHEEISNMADRMSTGLQKLIEAQETIAILKTELQVKEVELQEASVKAKAVLEKVTVKSEAVNKVKRAVQQKTDKAQAMVDVIQKDQGIAKEKLEAARPALEEAEAALNTIKPADISTVRKLGKPPNLIMRIMDCVLLLFQRKTESVSIDSEKNTIKTSWSDSLKFLSAGNFLQSLLTFPKDTINAETVELLKPYLNMDDYNYETAKRVCGNVAGLAAWTGAMAVFYEINREVLPLKANLAVATAKLNAANDELQEAQSQLAEKQKEQDAVQAEYDEAMGAKQSLEDDAERCRRKMNTATELISGLAGEKERWTQQSIEFKSQIVQLIGDVLITASFLSYSGPFNQDFRRQRKLQLQNHLRKYQIAHTPSLSVINMMVDPTVVAVWNMEGLPNDELSIQNGLIVTRSSRYPLLIDPQIQGKNWIKNKEQDNDLMITTLNDKMFRQNLEDALSCGRPLIIEDIGEELDPVLDNILDKNFIKSGTLMKVKLGDREIDMMKGFRLYITTKLANPVYTPEISAATAIVDFSVTQKGLEDQLLGRVIEKEKSDLETERIKLMKDIQTNKEKMKELEDNLLYQLTSVQGSLVDDENLIIVLKNTKITSLEVNQKLEIAKDTGKKIDIAREEYRPVACRGSILYFLIVEMSLVNDMYQTSLEQFLNLFDVSLDESLKSPIPSKRIINIINFMTMRIYNYTMRGLYEIHKNTFTLLLALKIDMENGKVKHEEFMTLIKGGAALDLNTVEPKPCKWIVDATWLNVVALSNLHYFSGIQEQLQRNDKQWKQWWDKECPEVEPLPSGYEGTLDTFKKFLLVRCWCPDRIIASSQYYIADSLGKYYIESVLLDLEATWNESSSRIPLTGLLSMGSDPTSNIDNLSKKLKIKLRQISMGQGQEVHARRYLSQLMTSGGWLLLQNCHLSIDYIHEVMSVLNETENIHNTFRLWVTTEPTNKFPITFLQKSIKFTNEPPSGVKAGLSRTYKLITQDYLDITNMPQWKPMLYAVAFLHSVIQERRKFGPLGWNIPYEFNTSDFNASVTYVQRHLDDIDPKKGVNWACIRYMLSEIHYGGRVTDDFDSRLLKTFCKIWFGENLLQPNFAFYKKYIVPKANKIQDYQDYIAGLATNDTPEVFGLHPNADITYQSVRAKEMLDSIMSIQPKDSGGASGMTREDIVYKLCDDMLNKLPPNYIGHEVAARLQKMGPLQPMNIFLRQEVDRMNKVIVILRQNLINVKLAIDGTIIMSENLRDIVDAMYESRVAKQWLNVSWDSTSLGFWFTELVDRNTQFHDWIFVRKPNYFWMTGFFNPQGFLTAMRQEVTRAHKGWALDMVHMQNEVLRIAKDDVKESPLEGVYVHGLYLEGASWDRRGCRLIQPKPKILYENLPLVHIYAINSIVTVDNKMYPCPIYKKPRRTDLTYISTIYLKTNVPPQTWILRGHFINSKKIVITGMYQFELTLTVFYESIKEVINLSVINSTCPGKYKTIYKSNVSQSLAPHKINIAYVYGLVQVLYIQIERGTNQNYYRSFPYENIIQNKYTKYEFIEQVNIPNKFDLKIQIMCKRLKEEIMQTPQNNIDDNFMHLMANLKLQMFVSADFKLLDTSNNRHENYLHAIELYENHLNAIAPLVHILSHIDNDGLIKINYGLIEYMDCFSAIAFDIEKTTFMEKYIKCLLIKKYYADYKNMHFTKRVNQVTGQLLSMHKSNHVGNNLHYAVLIILLDDKIEDFQSLLIKIKEIVQLPISIIFFDVDDCNKINAESFNFQCNVQFLPLECTKISQNLKEYSNDLTTLIIVLLGGFTTLAYFYWMRGNPRFDYIIYAIESPVPICFLMRMQATDNQRKENAAMRWRRL